MTDKLSVDGDDGHSPSSSELANGVPPDAEPPSEAPVVDTRPNYSIFTTWEKRCIVMASAAAAFFSPLTAQIYLPALTILASDFHITSAQANLTVTTYMVSHHTALVHPHPGVPALTDAGSRYFRASRPCSSARSPTPRAGDRLT